MVAKIQTVTLAAALLESFEHCRREIIFDSFNDVVCQKSLGQSVESIIVVDELVVVEDEVEIELQRQKVEVSFGCTVRVAFRHLFFLLLSGSLMTAAFYGFLFAV